LARQRAQAERLIGFVLTGLWDLGFEVARVDHKVLASLLDARFLAGSVSLNAMLERNAREAAKEVGATAVAATLAPTLLASGGATPKDEEEPDVKRGPGALRDIERVLWLARLGHLGAASGARSELAGWDAPVPAVVADARRFLWQVRCHLQLLAGRAQDRLLHEFQPPVARRLGLSRGSDTGVAELMARYRACTHSVRALLTAP
jgi:[protein-PII] uridylyltransferase